jgi:DNA processing protein
MTSGCPTCARRSRLLVRLAVSLDFRGRDPERFWEILELPDDLLISALGGRKRGQLRTWHAHMPEEGSKRELIGVETTCRHRKRYPSTLRDCELAPCELHVMGGADRLLGALDRPVVAIVGSRRCTDYGLEVAHRLAHELAAAGACLVSELWPGIAGSALTGAIEAGGVAIALMASGLDSCPASCEPLYRLMSGQGCIVSELPGRTRSRPWSELALARTLCLLAGLVIVVEAESSPRELACARLAGALGKPLAAVPGRVTSRASEGSNRLLKEGAGLVRTTEDALDLLYGIGPPRPARPATDPPRLARPDISPPRLARPDISPPRPARSAYSPKGPREPLGRAPARAKERPKAPSSATARDTQRLEPRLQEVLRMIGDGKDTISELDAQCTGRDVPLLELAELELRGLLRRGDGGRYVPCAVAPCR